MAGNLLNQMIWLHPNMGYTSQHCPTWQFDQEHDESAADLGIITQASGNPLLAPETLSRKVAE